MPSIIALPLEILSQIPRHLHHLDDFLALESMCRHLRAALHLGAPGDLLALCYRSRATFFRPDPHFLLSALIPAIREYASSSEAHRVEVKRAIWHGCEGLLEWACHTPAVATIARWSIKSIHDLWEWRMRVLNPLSDLVDKCVGRQWYSTPDFWDGGVEDAYTFHAEPETQVFQVQMYGDMFGTLMDACVTSGSTDPLGLAFRLDFVKYLIPDWLVDRAVAYAGHNIPSGRAPSPTDYFVTNDLPTTTARHSNVHPLRAVQTVFGPYINRDQGESQKALIHLISDSPLWTTLVHTLRAQCCPDFWTDPAEETEEEDVPPEISDDEGDVPAEVDEVEQEAGSDEVEPQIADEANEAPPDDDENDADADGDDDDDDDSTSEESAFDPPTHFDAAAVLDTAFDTPSRPSAQWKQQLWEACPYALGRSFLEMLVHIWRVRGAEEVELLDLRRRARLHRRRHQRRQQDTTSQEPVVIEGEPYDATRHAELQARADIARAHPDLVETGTGWDTLRRWHTAITAMEHEPTRVRVGVCETHEGYPDFVGDMLVATRDGRGWG
jgi:hypothetical protein